MYGSLLHITASVCFWWACVNGGKEIGVVLVRQPIGTNTINNNDSNGTIRTFLCGNGLVAVLEGYHRREMRNLFIADDSADFCQNGHEMINSLTSDVAGRIVLAKREYSCSISSQANMLYMAGANALILEVISQLEADYESPISDPIFINTVLLVRNDAIRMTQNATLKIGIYDPANFSPLDPSHAMMLAIIVFCLSVTMMWTSHRFSSYQRIAQVSSNPRIIEWNIHWNRWSFNKVNKRCIILTTIVTYPIASTIGDIFLPATIMYHVKAVAYSAIGFQSLKVCSDRLISSIPHPSLRNLAERRVTSHSRWWCDVTLKSVVTMTVASLLLVAFHRAAYYRCASGWLIQNLISAAICITVSTHLRIQTMYTIIMIYGVVVTYDVARAMIIPYIYKLYWNNITSPLSTGAQTSRSGKIMIDTGLTLMQVEPWNVNISKPFGFSLPLILRAPSTCRPIAGRLTVTIATVLMSAFLASFCAKFDLVKRNRRKCRIYSTVLMVSYVSGYAQAVVAMTTWNNPQPASLYILPLTVVSVVVVAVINKDVDDIFRRSVFSIERENESDFEGRQG